MENKQDKSLDSIKLPEPENNIFYSLGTPIRITSQSCGLSLYIDREDYDPKELHQSFMEKNINILLFKTEEEALAYSRFLQIKPAVHSGLDAFQRPIFKGRFLGDVNSLIFKEEDIIINNYALYQKGFFDGKNMQSKKSVNYCEVKRKEVELVFASLNVHGLDDDNGFNEAEYTTPLTLDYTGNLEHQLKTKKGRCVIC